MLCVRVTTLFLPVPLPTLEIRSANPVEVAEYAVTAQIDDEPAFKWWVPSVLRRRNKIISKVQGKYWRTSHNYGIRLPHSIKEALDIDKETGTDLWSKAIEKEMARVRVSFEEWDKGSTRAEAKEKVVGFKEIPTHMIFDIKIGDLVRKCRLVADGHKIEPDVSTITYSSVVSRDSIRILFMYAALNDLELNSADIGNAYLNAPCRSKYWTVAGPEFGSDEGKVYIIVRALYGLPCAGSSWRAFFAEILENTLGFVPTRADPDVYRRRNVRPDGTAYYEMFAVWVDDILILSHDTAPIIAELMARFRLKKIMPGML